MKLKEYKDWIAQQEKELGRPMTWLEISELVIVNDKVERSKLDNQSQNP